MKNVQIYTTKWYREYNTVHQRLLASCMQRTVSRTDAHNRDGGANVAAVKAVQQTTVNENNGDISVQQVVCNVVQ